MERKYLLCLSGALILASLAIIFILPNLSSAPAGYLQLYDIKKDEKVGGLYCNIYYLEWHGRKTDLEFLFYTRERVAGYSVPASAGGQWIPGGKEDPIPIKDLGV